MTKRLRLFLSAMLLVAVCFQLNAGSDTYTIDGISSSKGKDAKELVIITKEEIHKGDKLTVKYQHSVRGRILQRTVGEIKVKETYGNNAVCKVTKGGKDIYRIYYESPEKLILIR